MAAAVWGFDAGCGLTTIARYSQVTSGHKSQHQRVIADQDFWKDAILTANKMFKASAA